MPAFDFTPLHVVVLGANGFLGAAMTQHLARLGHRVTAFWRRPQPHLLKLANVTSVIGDLRDTWTLADALENADVVYHFASATYPSLFYLNPSAEYWEALQPLLVLMETAARGGVGRIVFPSSGGTIYADSELPRNEDSPLAPRSPYAIFKLTAEQLLMHAARQGQFAVDIYRIGNPFGPGQRARPGQGVLPHWIEAVKSGSSLRMFGDGSAERDYIFVDDVCQLLTLSCAPRIESDIFNVGTGRATSLNALKQELERLLGHQLSVEFLPPPPSTLQSIALQSDKLLGLAPDFRFTPLREGISMTLASHGLLSS